MGYIGSLASDSQQGAYALPAGESSSPDTLALGDRDPLAMLVNPVSVPEYVRGWRPAWGFSQIVAFGRRVSAAAKAMGIPRALTANSQFGMMQAFLSRCVSGWISRSTKPTPYPAMIVSFRLSLAIWPPDRTRSTTLFRLLWIAVFSRNGWAGQSLRAGQPEFA